MAQHTPGPWEVWMARSCLRPNEDPNKPFEDLELEANAHLISAAPDLLAALEAVLDMPNNPLALYEARAAIAKAKGE